MGWAKPKNEEKEEKKKQKMMEAAAAREKKTNDGKRKSIWERVGEACGVSIFPAAAFSISPLLRKLLSRAPSNRVFCGGGGGLEKKKRVMNSIFTSKNKISLLFFFVLFCFFLFRFERSREKNR